MGNLAPTPSRALGLAALAGRGLAHALGVVCLAAAIGIGSPGVGEAQRARTPLIVVVESAGAGISPAVVRAQVGAALGRPALSPADPGAEGVSELLLVVLSADGTWGVVTYARGDGSVETLRGSGPADSGRPRWLGDAVLSLVVGDEAVDAPRRRAAAEPPSRRRAPPRSTPPRATLGEELVSWRIPREVIDPFREDDGGGRVPVLSYEILDPWRRGDTVDPWAPSRRRTLRTIDPAAELSAPPPPNLPTRQRGEP